MQLLLRAASVFTHAFIVLEFKKLKSLERQNTVLTALFIICVVIFIDTLRSRMLLVWFLSKIMGSHH